MISASQALRFTSFTAFFTRASSHLVAGRIYYMSQFNHIIKIVIFKENLSIASGTEMAAVLSGNNLE